ncbi:MAG: hypothetical protein ACPL1Z_00215 [Candidatus Bathyarchaeales archaeon]
MRINSRSIEEITWDLNKIKELAFVAGMASQYKTKLAEELRSIVAGCFELIVAEAFSIKLGLGYFLSNELEPPPCVVWNGQLDNFCSKIVPKCAPQGKPDIEVYTSTEVWVVDATLSREKEIQLAEVRRLIRHNPANPSSNIKRILVTPSPQTRREDVEIIEVKMLMPISHLPKRGKLSYVEEADQLIKRTCVKSGN